MEEVRSRVQPAVAIETIYAEKQATCHAAQAKPDRRSLETCRLLEAWVGRRGSGTWSPCNSYTDDRVELDAAADREIT